MTKTLLLGANGGVGQHLVTLFQSTGTDFTASVRDHAQKEALESKGIATVYIDIEKESIESLAKLFQDYNQVIFSVGSGGHTGADKTIIIDLDGAVKAIKASEAAKVENFIMVSTYDSRREAFDANGDLKPYTIAKHYADDYLRRSALTATIVHPGALTNGSGTGKIRAAQYFDQPNDRKIPREDVAAVLFEVATNPQHWGKEFQILTGETPIAEALSTL